MKLNLRILDYEQYSQNKNSKRDSEQVQKWSNIRQVETELTVYLSAKRSPEPNYRNTKIGRKGVQCLRRLHWSVKFKQTAMANIPRRIVFVDKFDEKSGESDVPESTCGSKQTSHKSEDRGFRVSSRRRHQSWGAKSREIGLFGHITDGPKAHSNWARKWAQLAQFSSLGLWSELGRLAGRVTIPIGIVTCSFSLRGVHSRVIRSSSGTL